MGLIVTVLLLVWAVKAVIHYIACIALDIDMIRGTLSEPEDSDIDY